MSYTSTLYIYILHLLEMKYIPLNRGRFNPEMSGRCLVSSPEEKAEEDANLGDLGGVTQTIHGPLRNSKINDGPKRRYPAQ